MTERKTRRTTKDAVEYRILRGISWPKTDEQGKMLRDKEDRPLWHDVEAGEIRDDLPTKHVEEWIRIGAIEPVTDDAPATPQEG